MELKAIAHGFFGFNHSSTTGIHLMELKDNFMECYWSGKWYIFRIHLMELKVISTIKLEELANETLWNPFNGIESL